MQELSNLVTVTETEIDE